MRGLIDDTTPNPLAVQLATLDVHPDNEDVSKRMVARFDRVKDDGCILLTGPTNHAGRPRIWWHDRRCLVARIIVVLRNDLYEDEVWRWDTRHTCHTEELERDRQPIPRGAGTIFCADDTSVQPLTENARELYDRVLQRHSDGGSNGEDAADFAFCCVLLRTGEHPATVFEWLRQVSDKARRREEWARGTVDAAKSTTNDDRPNRADHIITHRRTAR